MKAKVFRNKNLSFTYISIIHNINVEDLREEYLKK